MNMLLAILVSINLNIPDSVFVPTNALEINPPEWKFVLETEENKYIELAYHTLFKVSLDGFYLGIIETSDFEPYLSLKNRYYISTPYFSINHGISGIYRKRNRYTVFLRDTLDFYFSAGRFVPNITFIPGVNYFKRDSVENTFVSLPVSLSFVYSGSEGILTYAGIERVDILAEDRPENIYRVGVGLMGNRKFVSLGLTSKMIPEFDLKVLVVGGAYVDMHFGYDIKTPDIFSYIYPEALMGGQVISTMEKRFSLLLDKDPLYFQFTYAVPDTFFKRSLKMKFAWKGRYIDLKGEYFKLLDNYSEFITDFGAVNRVVSRGEIMLHIPLWKGVYYHPSIDVFKVQGLDDKVYNLWGRLEYGVGRFKFFWEHNLLNEGRIEAVSPYASQVKEFYTARRFKIGAKYSF